MLWPVANSLYRKQTFDNYDAQRAILKCVYEGLSVKTIDAGLPSRRAILPRWCAVRRRPT